MNCPKKIYSTNLDTNPNRKKDTDTETQRYRQTDETRYTDPKEGKHETAGNRYGPKRRKETEGKEYEGDNDQAK